MSDDDRLLVIDEGTTGTRALVFDGTGRRLGASYSEFTQHYPAPDRVEHDAEEIWQRTRERIDDVLAETGVAPSSLAAVGITNQRGTSLLWDRATGEAVTPAIVWQDLRTAGIAARLAPEWGARVQARTGWTLAPVYSCLSLHWLLADDAELRARAQAGELAFGTIDSWLVHRLSGGAAHVISASNTVVTGCYDLVADGWYGEWLDALEIPRAVLPEVVDDSGVIATTSADVFGAEVPIAAAVADQSAALFGQGCLAPGEGKTTHGTGTFFDLNTGTTPVISEHGLSTIIAWRREGVTTYGLEGYAAVTGSAIQWLRDGAGVLRTAAETDELARGVADNGGVYFVPALTGLAAPSWDSSARGLIIGISPGTTRGHLARAALEGIVYSVKDFVELMAAESGRPITVLRADGGAAANDFLLQFQADMLGATVHRPADVEATALGAAYLAGLAVGVWKTPEDCFRGHADDAVFTPSVDDDTREARYEEWGRAVERAKGVDPVVRRFTPADLPDRADVLVIGGGITGASVARDAALRGLATVLVDRDDVASGTSSRSSKLIHGGLRYLQTHQFAMVHESVREREVMLRLAPHLADLRPFLYLLYRGYPEGRALLGAGLTVYDALSRAPLRRWHRMLGRAAVLRREPHLNPDGLTGAGLYHDVLTDDARLVVDVLESASRAGALVANHRAVTGLVRERGRVAGAEVTDRISGEHIAIRARTVVNATGPWVDDVLGMERDLDRPPAAPTLRPTKGVHLVLRAADFPLHTAVFLRSPSDGRVVWPTPSRDGGHVYIGTTDTAFHGSPSDVVADESDVAYLLEVANHTLPDARVGPEHVVATWAGLRPIVAPPPGTSNSDASREHVISEGPTGLITVAGGKLTTARIMGRQIVERVVDQLRSHHGVRSVPPSTTGDVAIAGGDPGDRFRAERAVADVPPDLARRWLGRYGGNADRVAAAGSHDVVAGTDLTDAEIRHAVENEMAMTVSDVLVRRTGSFFWSADGDAAAVDHVSDALARAHGYPAEVRAAQQAAYADWVARNRGRRVSR